MAWFFHPNYTLRICKANGEAFTSRTLRATQCNLSIAPSANQSIFTLSDSKNEFIDVVGPHANDAIQLALKNRHGEWGIAWTGLIDSIHQVADPTQGRYIQIAATDPVKLWEVTTQSASDAQTLAVANATGINGTTLLNLSIARVKYPSPPLILAGQLAEPPYTPKALIDPLADSGVNSWANLPANIASNPNMQSWSAPISSLQADSGLEWFFDEGGNLTWRRPWYLNVQHNPRRILKEDILAIDLGETDQGVVTSVMVQWGVQPTIQAAALWPPAKGRPDLSSVQQAMITQLGWRQVILYAPWIRSPDAAQYLAQALFQMYSANVLVGTVTIAADPLFQIGKVIEIPSLRKNHSDGFYYTSAVSYQLDWGATWTMTLGLSYGRAFNQTFPYLSTSANPTLSYPQLTLAQRVQGTEVNQTSLVIFDQNTASIITNPFTLVVNSSITDPTVVYIDARIISAGQQIALKDSTGKPIGPRATYTSRDVPTNLANPDDPPKFVIYMADTAGVSTGFVQLTDQGYGTGATTGDNTGSRTNSSGQPGGTSPAPGSTNSDPSIDPGKNGVNIHFPGYFSAWPTNGGALNNLSQNYGSGPGTYYKEPNLGIQDSRYGFSPFHEGIDIAVGTDSPDFAVMEGVVTWVGITDSTIDGVGANVYGYSGFGFVVAVRAENFTTMYGHGDATKTPLVSIGDHVYAGRQIGYTGGDPSTPGHGNSNGAHLHFGVWDHKNSFWTDPTPFFTANHITGAF